jgi:4-phytase/acid phosphatase/peptide/nickel transport system substrate-binding protein
MANTFRRRTLARAIALAAAAGLVAQPALAQKQGGSLRVALEADIPGFDPLKVGVYDSAAMAAASLIFDTLTGLDDQGRAIPRLAVSWSSSADFRTWTFKLRPGVTFQDGTPFNAQAVAWNYARQKDPANNCRCAFFVAGLLKIEAVDDLTVVFTSRNPAVSLPVMLAVPTANGVVQSPSAIQARGEDYNRHPVGTGPFVVKSWAVGDRMVLERNPHYWNAGHPHLDRIELQPVPDSDTRFAGLEAGQTDVMWADEYQAEQIKKAGRMPSLQVLHHVGSGAFCFAFNTDAAPLDDVRVRRALVMAVDRRKMSELLTGGISRPASNPFGDGSWIRCKDDAALPTDPAKAHELIQEYGKPVDLKMLVTASPRGRAGGQVMQEFWKRIGVHLEIEQIEQAALVPRAFRRQFQITPWRIGDYADPGPLLYAYFHTGSPLALANYEDEELDKLLEQAGRTADPDQRARDYCAASRIVNQQAIWLWMFQNTYYAIARAKVKGIRAMYNGTLDVSEAWLE